MPGKLRWLGLALVEYTSTDGKVAVFDPWFKNKGKLTSESSIRLRGSSQRAEMTNLITILAILLAAVSLISCTSTADAPSVPKPTTSLPTPSPLSKQVDYRFPDTIDPNKRYLFYLHGKIIEDQGIPAISPDFGEYKYQAILEKLSGYGFVVLSEQRPKNTDGIAYARKIKREIMLLLDAGVPAKHITVVGASKGAGITVYISHFLKNQDVNFIIMAICHPDVIENFKQNQIFLTGNVLSIYDFKDDTYAGSCQELFSFSEGKGINQYDEIVLQIGTGHGILYQPLDAWILPAIGWARQDAE
jgi:hypothetical protein